ncbi:hypothetical protein [Chryseobacterium taiwanense]|uniref:Uncharacterized protein n=1 Tax=Chryseobacterium taiwanense TaxID=363331 RepID=A0A0B4DAZ1_9FLAO|nr:hypothetical protein [Chryseobacterium taiwanense]KIC61500.1 hypothetical protein RM51_16950 [Chryseobacterium taiwanense]
MKNNTLNKLKSGYEELEIKPSSDLWDRLEGKLEEKPGIVLKPSFQGWKYAAVIVLLISLGTFLYYNADQKSQSEKVKITQNTSENTVKSAVEQDEPVVLNENTRENSIYPRSDKNSAQSNNSSEKLPEKIEQSKNVAVAEKENIIEELPTVLTEKPEIAPVKPQIANRKKTSYISADDLLLGRELDKTRNETQTHKQFGVLDVSKIKIKRPNSLQIFGFKVFSDSTEIK